MNQVANVAHKAAIGTLVFASFWGAYSVAGGTTIIVKRRYNRKSKEAAADKETHSLTPLEPKTFKDESTTTFKRVD